MVTASGCTAGTMGAPCPPGGDSALRCPRRRAGRQATEPNHDRPDGSPRADRPLERGRGRRSAPSLPPAVRAALSPLPGVRRRNRAMTDGWLTTCGPPAGMRAGTAQRAVPTSRRARRGTIANRPDHPRPSRRAEDCQPYPGAAANGMTLQPMSNCGSRTRAPAAKLQK